MKRKLSLVILIIIIISLTIIFKKKSNSEQNISDSQLHSHQSHQHDNDLKITPRESTNSAITTSRKFAHKIPANRMESIEALTELIANFEQISPEKMASGNLAEELKNQLNEWKLIAIETKNKNSKTGTMQILRTQNALPDARYIHAQFFDGVLQHMSFEIRKTESSFTEVTKSLKTQFKLKEPSQKTSQIYSLWKLSDRYILWAKTLTKEDIKNDPFNAYTEADIGTIRVAMELEIH